MEIKFKGQMTIAEFRQALFEQVSAIEENYAVHYTRGATLYLNPTDQFGQPVRPRNQLGHAVEKVWYDGAYTCAADKLDPK